VIAKCKICSRSFYTKPFWVKNGGGKYCSLTCKYKGSRLGKNLPCFVCNKVKYHPKGRMLRAKSGKFFCSKSCQAIWRNSYYIGEKHGNYKDGNSVYRSVLTRHKVPAVCKLCESKDRRVLAVHHLDKKRSNNKVENLVWLCHNCHHLVHYYNYKA
jgi:hypothetical protein